MGKTIAVALISAGLGLIIGEHLTEKRLLEDFDIRLEQELEASVTYLEETGRAEPTEEYEERRVASTFDLTKPTIESLTEQNQRVRYDAIVRREYAGGDDTSDEDLKDSLKQGLVGKLPSDYLETISTEEYMSEESGYDQMSYTYTGDGILLDEDNTPIEDQIERIGAGDPPFGDGSGEPHVVYIRNNILREEYEVIHDPDVSAADLLKEDVT